MRSKSISGKFNRQNLQWLLLSAFLFLMVSTLKAQSAEALYEKATAFYKENQFEKAAATYEEMVALNYRHASVYYNLGNSYYKLGNIGKSILNYERAHKLAPDDEDVAHNLTLAQTRARDRIVPVPQLAIIQSWKSFLSYCSPSGWRMFAVTFAWLTLLVVVVYLFWSKKSFVFLSGILFLLLSISSLLLAVTQSRAAQSSDAAILVVSKANVKSAPDNNATELFVIHEGVKLQLLDKVGVWHKIRLADGKVGWVEERLFEKI